MVKRIRNRRDDYRCGVARRERDILERAVRAIAEQATKTNDLIDEVIEAASPPINLSRSQPRSAARTLETKAELQRGVSEFILDCITCGMEVHWVQASARRTLGIGATVGQRRMASRRFRNSAIAPSRYARNPITNPAAGPAERLSARARPRPPRLLRGRRKPTSRSRHRPRRTP